MHRFFITLAYNGENYVGWQIQPNGLSIQQLLQQSLSTILRKQVDVTGAGRTDAGVHAQAMVAHFDWNETILFDKHNLVLKLNSFLPKDISIISIQQVKADAHARFSAISRTYVYYVTIVKDPFLYPFNYKLHYTPDIELMNHLCNVLKEYEDFTSFSKLHTDVKTNNCHIYDAKWELLDEGFYRFTIKADRFLRNMVRAITGTLLEAGRGRLDERGFRRIIEAKNRNVAGESVPGNALFLESIVYPDDIWL